jgi:hypothetical protein
MPRPLILLLPYIMLGWFGALLHKTYLHTLTQRRKRHERTFRLWGLDYNLAMFKIDPPRPSYAPRSCFFR